MEIINIESVNIPDELIYHFNTNNTYYNTIKNSDILEYTPHCNNDDLEYCKNNICACLYGYNIKPFIDFPDDKGNIYRYILVPYAVGYKQVISIYTEYNNNILVSTECKTDSQCFSNKCNNNICTFNSESNVKRCNILYTKPSIITSSKSYYYCGKAFGESCLDDLECSSKTCNNYKCDSYYYEPSESDTIKLKFEKFIFITSIFITIIIILCCAGYYFIKYISHQLNTENNE